MVSSNQASALARAIPEAQEAHIIYGAYDIIAKLKTETMQDLKEIISWKIRR